VPRETAVAVAGIKAFFFFIPGDYYLTVIVRRRAITSTWNPAPDASCSLALPKNVESEKQAWRGEISKRSRPGNIFSEIQVRRDRRKETI